MVFFSYHPLATPSIQRGPLGSPFPPVHQTRRDFRNRRTRRSARWPETRSAASLLPHNLSGGGASQGGPAIHPAIPSRT